MIRITALNEDEQSDIESEEEKITVTKEAQETIAESEYMRAIKLKAQGKSDFTLSLLLELLDTKVINEITNDGKNTKLWAIRYNCHKNIAIIHEENGDVQKALSHFVQAMQIDDSDVYTMNRFGRLALNHNALELAEAAFDKCLQRNPLHYAAADCKLEIYCRNLNILGAFGWALKLYQQDPCHKKAALTLREISTKFKSLIPFYEKVWGSLPSHLSEYEWKEGIDSSVFPEPKEMCMENEKLKVEFPQDIDVFRIKSLDWLSFGRYIVDVYTHLEATGQSMLFSWTFPEIIFDPTTEISTVVKADEEDDVQEITEIDSNHSNSDTPETITATENSNAGQQDAKFDGELYSQSPKPSIFATPPLAIDRDFNSGEKTPNHDNNSDANDDSKSDGSDVGKPKPRRRCSDLHFLEQWGWHKSRRYSSRKKPQPERVEVDTSLNGFLRKVFSKFMGVQFDCDWPFVEKDDANTKLPVDNETEESFCQKCKVDATLESFQNETAKSFECFIEKFKGKHFDLMILIYKWLKYIALSWQTPMPNELKTLYLQIFGFYLRHFDFSSWNLLNANNYIASYKICLCYLELECDRTIEQGGAFSYEWKNVFNQLMFKSGTAYLILNELFDTFKLRLANLENLWCSYGGQYEKCVTCLENMLEIIDQKEEEFIVHLPNLGEYCITRKIIMKTKTDLQRQITLKTVPKLFEEEKWSELIGILKSNLMQSKDNFECENWVKDIKVQIEALLQALWEINDFEDCLIWAEKFFHYCVGRYLHENKFSYRQKIWAESMNYISSYLEALVLNEGFDIVLCLGENLSRLIQNIIRILTYQLDGPIDRNSSLTHELETKRLWVSLHQILLREESISPIIIKSRNNEGEEEDEIIPSSFLVLFTAHEFLGKRQWCMNDNGGILQYILDAIVPNLRAPLYDACREAVYEYIEQVTYCLYGYPQKKARQRHLEDHEACVIELTWPKAIQIFDLYRPENLPEFNSYKLESITADMEQLLIKILGLMPAELDPAPATSQILDFISGTTNQLPDDANAFQLPYKICTIFYLLADYHFKSRDFAKAIKYYTLDLACSPARFDSWAGMALSKASKIETKLNGLLGIELKSLMLECEETMRCFERCIGLDRNQILIWIEYGSFAYTLHAFCSRYLKQNAEKLSMEEFSSAEERKENMLQIAFNCFSYASTLQNSNNEIIEDDSESHDEKWLCQYMLGKIAEKRKEQPKVYLNYYLTAANYLYENNATYPIKVNHSNPTTLSVEALEVFYRTNSAIIKFLETTKEISRDIGDLFNSVLRSLSNSPFAYNKAKIDGNSLNAFKRKIADKMEQSSSAKILKESNEGKTDQTPKNVAENETNTEIAASSSSCNVNIDASKGADQTNTTENIESQPKISGKPTTVVSPSRRESQESAATITTTTVTSSTTSSSSSSDSSTSDSDSDSEGTSTEADSKNKNVPYTFNELKNIYKIIVQNLEECITRFPEHYKSIYRLVYHYMTAPAELCDLTKCEQLLLGQYKTSLGNQINGLFFDRKNNNLFNGIWRIPSSEVDRPGSFSAHLVKCVSLLERMLMKANNFQLLTDFGLQLHKNPDNDKRYIKDHDRFELYKQSILLSGQVIRNILKSYTEKRDDEVILNLLLDIYKTHKKCQKQFNLKESTFIQCIIDTYKLYIQDKVENLPDTLNFYDLAVKLCIQEISARKVLEKNASAAGSSRAMGDVMLGITTEPSAQSMLPPRPIQLPGLPLRFRARSASMYIKPTTNMNLLTHIPSFENKATSSNSPFGVDILNSPHVMSMMSMMGSTTPIGQKDNTEFQKMVREFYKQILEGGKMYPQIPFSTAMPSQSIPTLPTQPTLSFASSLPAETTITPSSVNSRNLTNLALPQNKIQTSNVAVTNTSREETQNMGVNPEFTDLTITPAKSNFTTTSVESAKSNILPPPIPNIYLQPISNLLATDLPKTLNPLPQAPQYPGLAQVNTITPVPTTKLQTKAKSSAKNKNIPQKPFERPTSSLVTNLPNSATTLADLAKISPIIKTLNAETQVQVLKAYADLLKGSVKPQKPPRAAPKKRQKAQSQAMMQSSMVPSTSASMETSLPHTYMKPGQQIPQQQQKPTFQLPTFDPSVMSISPITSTMSNVTSAPSNFPKPSYVIAGGASSSSSMHNIFSSQSNVQMSPTKTLQQKLAERQKANQLNDANTNPTEEKPQRKPSIDVIILD